MILHHTDLETTNLDADEWSSDISNVTSVLKLWLRDLPEPLLTMQLHQGFLDAASKHLSPPPSLGI
jgi:Rho GTPase-activating protein RGD1